MWPDWALPLVPWRWKGGTLFIMKGTTSPFSPFKGIVHQKKKKIVDIYSHSFNSKLVSFLHAEDKAVFSYTKNQWDPKVSSSKKDSVTVIQTPVI